MKNVRLSIPRDNNKVSANPYISANKAIRPTSSGFKQQLSPTNNSKGQANVSPAAGPNVSANNALDPTANGFKHQLSPNSNLDDQVSGPNTNSANNAPNVLDKGLTLTTPTKLQHWRNSTVRKNGLDKTLVFMTKYLLLFELLVNCTNMCVIAQREDTPNKTQQATYPDLVYDAHPVSDIPSVTDFVMEQNNSQKPLGIARNYTLPFGPLPKVHPDLTANCNQSQVDCMNNILKDISKINDTTLNGAAPPAPACNSPTSQQDQVDLNKDENDDDELPKAIVLQLLPKTEKSELELEKYLEPLTSISRSQSYYINTLDQVN